LSRPLVVKVRAILRRFLREELEELSSVERQFDLFRDQTLSRHAEAVALLRRDLSDLALQLSEFRATYAMSVSNLVPKVGALELALSTHLRTADGEIAVNVQPPPKLTVGAQPTESELDDSFYVAVLESFHGSPSAIRERARDYIADLASARELGPVLDLGCGRGELLDVLRDEGFEAYGVDTNSLCVEECRRLGLTVELADARQRLRDTAPSSLAAITAIHLVEHLPIESVVELIDAAMIALRPGGTLIIETANPENVLVSTLYFFLDPSQRKPIPPQLLQFVVAGRGIIDLEIRRLPRKGLIDAAVANPTEGEPWFGDLQPLVDAFNERFAAATDYALIARRP
jgi:O-antigen chain-terminating methyltransferase